MEGSGTLNEFPEGINHANSKVEVTKEHVSDLSLLRSFEKFRDRTVQFLVRPYRDLPQYDIESLVYSLGPIYKYILAKGSVPFRGYNRLYEDHYCDEPLFIRDVDVKIDIINKNLSDVEKRIIIYASKIIKHTRDNNLTGEELKECSESLSKNLHLILSYKGDYDADRI